MEQAILATRTKEWFVGNGHTNVFDVETEQLVSVRADYFFTGICAMCKKLQSIALNPIRDPDAFGENKRYIVAEHKESEKRCDGSGTIPQAVWK